MTGCQPSDTDTKPILIPSDMQVRATITVPNVSTGGQQDSGTANQLNFEFQVRTLAGPHVLQYVLKCS